MEIYGAHYLTVAEIMDLIQSIIATHRYHHDYYIKVLSDGSGYLVECISDYQREVRTSWKSVDRMERALVLYQAALEKAGGYIP